MEICDFGFGIHSLLVSTYSVFPVSFSDLQLILGQPIHLKAVLNPQPYGDSMHSNCWLYLRVRSEDDQPVPLASFLPRLVLNQDARVDSYGRYQTLFRGTQTLTFAAPGFLPATAEVSCRGHKDIELLIVMKRSS